MNKLLRPRFWVVLPYFFLLLLLVFGISCKKGFDAYYSDTSPKGGYVYDKVRKDSNFTVFAKGLEKAGLVKYINNGGLYTVFAPTNAAFNNFFAANGYGSINDVPADVLFRLMSFHIVNNMWHYYEFKYRFATYKQVLYLTRNNKFVSVDVSAVDSIKVNGVPVINSLRDIDADNGVIHGIGIVLVPVKNVEEVLKSEFGNSTFYQLLQVVADSVYDRFNSYDKNGDGVFDSFFYKTYNLSTVYASLEYRQNTAPDNQGGDPVFTTALIPADAALNTLIAPAIAKIDPSVTNKIAALSPTYAQAVLESYFLYDTISAYNSLKFITKPAGVNYRSVNSEIIPTLSDAQFISKDVPASNGIVHQVNITFPQSDRLKSVIALAAMNPDLSNFVAALQKANLVATLGNTARAGTYLAPTNAAFQAASLDVKKMTLNGLALTTTQFSNIMKNHIIDANLANAAALTGSKATNYGNSNTLTFTNGGTTVTTNLGLVATVTLPAAAVGPTSNGYVYKVDKILIPVQ